MTRHSIRGLWSRWSIVAIGPIALAPVLAGCAGASPSSAPTASATRIASSTPGRTAEASVSSTETPSSISSLLTGRILFTRVDLDDDFEHGQQPLFVAHADGTEDVAFGGPLTYGPRWSWDGRQILEGLIDGDRATTCVFDADGSSVGCVPLPEGTLSLNPGVWAPDGEHMAFEGKSGDAFGTGLYVGSLDGIELQRLTDFHVYPADFTPDGQRILYLMPLPWDSVGAEVMDVGQLLYRNVDGSGTSTAVTPQELPVEWTGTPPRLSRDGRWVAFASLGDIWKIRLDGTDRELLYHDPEGRHAFAPTWSPAGDAILFVLDPAEPARPDDQPPPYHNRLVVMRADGSDPTVIIATPDWKLEPDWTR